MWNMPTGEPPHKIKGSAPLYLPQLRWCGKSTITKMIKQTETLPYLTKLPYSRA